MANKVAMTLRFVQPYVAVYRHVQVERERTAEVVVLVDEEDVEKIKTGTKTVMEKREDHVRVYKQPIVVEAKKGMNVR